VSGQRFVVGNENRGIAIARPMVGNELFDLAHVLADRGRDPGRFGLWYRHARQLSDGREWQLATGKCGSELW
jgi:hypothetical protein